MHNAQCTFNAFDSQHCHLIKSIHSIAWISLVRMKKVWLWWSDNHRIICSISRSFGSSPWIAENRWGTDFVSFMCLIHNKESQSFFRNPISMDLNISIKNCSRMVWLFAIDLYLCTNLQDKIIFLNEREATWSARPIFTSLYQLVREYKTHRQNYQTSKSIWIVVQLNFDGNALH